MMRSDPTCQKVIPIEAHRRVSHSASQANDDPAYWAGQMAAVAENRDVDCFMRLFAHFGPRLQRYLVGLGVAAPQAEELVQEAMLRVWRRANQFDPSRANVSTWLFRIARNLYIDSIRGEPHWLPIQDGLDWLDQRTDDDANSTEWFADGVGLERAIDELPPQQARVIRMSYFEAKSHSEIAQELGQPLGSVKSNLRRAFAKLQAGLRKTP
ncbi:sigma-70 family RNA polymerase sigma factor [Luteibacter flocculans]|uniref:RNA polymerase sigma factor n=1 Tax=Luteibacter flocculans TaxID=2780091 RepID=A0ABY4T2G0_9GAMM|nr:sigma-70 family RNA polymerase sigma factor [Luteibacter flocculans]URL56986.1 sigma-70 family RNA polymerase sigma factor [Luteibacter flocculans]